MSLSICSTCPSTLRSHCSRFNYSLHHPKKKDIKPVLSEFERVCIFLKSIYVAEGKEYVFYEGGVMELGLTRDAKPIAYGSKGSGMTLSSCFKSLESEETQQI
jgi:hypothetical protein